MLKSFWNWLLDTDKCRTNRALITSITGVPLIKENSGLGIYATKEGKMRGKVAVAMMLGDNSQVCKDILKGDLDFCLTAEDKQKYICEIRRAVIKGGEYLTTERDDDDCLHFVRENWKDKDLKEIMHLLVKYESVDF